MCWSNTEEKTSCDIDKEEVGDLELEILGSGVEVWQLECNLLIYVPRVRNVLFCLQAWTLLTCQSADLRVHVWGCVVECQCWCWVCFSIWCAATFRVTFLSHKWQVLSAEAWKQPLRYQNGFPALKDAPWVWLNSTTLSELCCQFLFQRTSF